MAKGEKANEATQKQERILLETTDLAEKISSGKD